jgi:DNA-binding response OmpR family regulator
MPWLYSGHPLSTWLEPILSWTASAGLDVLKEVKKIRSETGVFILTGQGDMSMAIDALRSAADDFLLKPCDADELVLRMEHVLEKQEALRKIKIYEKFLPICMYCKKIRDDTGMSMEAGRWLQPEEFLTKKSGIDLTHGCCPECSEKYNMIGKK